MAHLQGNGGKYPPPPPKPTDHERQIVTEHLAEEQKIKKAKEAAALSAAAAATDIWSSRANDSLQQALSYLPPLPQLPLPAVVSPPTSKDQDLVGNNNGPDKESLNDHYLV